MMIRVTPVGSNQAVVDLFGAELFFSYSTCVAGFIPGLGLFRDSAKYSATTSRHVNAYLDGRKAKMVTQTEIEQAVKAFMSNHND